MSIYRPVFEGLNRKKVRYVVVGGLAVVLHGRARFTADVDLVLDLSAKQVSTAVKVLQELGLRPRLPVPADSFADPEVRRKWIEEKGMDVFTFWAPDNPLLVVDVFANPPLPFQELWRDSSTRSFMGLQVRVASLPHLIEMKKKAGRAIDREDLRFLEELAQRGDDSSG